MGVEESQLETLLETSEQVTGRLGCSKRRHTPQLEKAAKLAEVLEWWAQTIRGARGRTKSAAARQRCACRSFGTLERSQERGPERT